MIEKGGEDNKGVDICFSPSKDWTLIYNLVDDETRLKMNAIRDRADDKISKAIEQNTYVRITENGKTKHELARATGIAKFNHHTSREVKDKDINPLGYIDPQEHTHFTCLPKALGKDGKFHSHTLLDAKYEHKNGHETLRYFDSVGQLELAKGLQELGFNIEVADEHSNFKVKGITDEFRYNFSKRCKQIDKIAGPNATYNEKKNISLKVRASKDSHNLTDLRNFWQNEAKQLGFDIDKLNSIKEKQQDNHKSFSEIMKENNNANISTKKLKTIANNQAKFSTKSSKEIFEEYKNDKKLLQITKQVNFHQSNNFYKKVAENYSTKNLDKLKSKLSNLETKKPDTKKPNIQNPKIDNFFKGLMNTIKPKNNINNILPTAKNKNEILSNIKSLEEKLFSLDITDPNYGTQYLQLLQQIGDLKAQLMATDKNNNTVSNETTNFNNSNHIEPKTAENEKTESKEEKQAREEKELKRLNDIEETKKLIDKTTYDIVEKDLKSLNQDTAVNNYIDENIKNLSIQEVVKLIEFNENKLTDKLLEIEENKENLTDGRLNNELSKHSKIHNQVNDKLYDRYKALSKTINKEPVLEK